MIDGCGVRFLVANVPLTPGTCNGARRIPLAFRYPLVGSLKAAKLLCDGFYRGKPCDGLYKEEGKSIGDQETVSERTTPQQARRVWEWLSADGAARLVAQDPRRRGAPENQ